METVQPVLPLNEGKPVAAVEIFIVLSLYIYVLFRLPELRLAGSIVAFVAIGGLVFYMVTVPPEPEIELNRISVDEVTLDELELELGPRVATLSGRAVNGSDTYTLIGIDLIVKVYDCPNDEVPLDECFIIGEDDGYARLSAPPRQLRQFTATLLFNNMPDIEGVLRWDYGVTDLRALETDNR